MAFYLIVINSKQIVSIGNVRHYPELVTVTGMRLAKFVVLYFVSFCDVQAKCSLGIFFCTLEGMNLFAFRITGGGGVLHLEGLEISLPWLFFLCDRYHCLHSAMYIRTVRYFVVAVQ